MIGVFIRSFATERQYARPTPTNAIFELKPVVAYVTQKSYQLGMTTPSYIQDLRQKIGHDRLMMPSVAAIIRDDRGRLLLQRKAGSEGWSLPAGAIELGETPDEALSREVFEETGFKVVSAALTGAFGGDAFRYTYPNGDRVEYTVLLYRCQVQFLATEPIDPETTELRYFGVSDAPPLALPYPKSALF